MYRSFYKPYFLKKFVPLKNLNITFKKIPEYKQFNIPEEIRKHLPPEKKFIELMKSCAEDRPDFYENSDLDYGSVGKITRELTYILKEGKTIERAITVDNVENFIKSTKKGMGLGESWSYRSGKIIEGIRNHRYNITIDAKIIDPLAIDFMATYCHEQVDSWINLNPDEEITMTEGKKVKITSMDIYDNKDNSFIKTMKFNKFIAKI